MLIFHKIKSFQNFFDFFNKILWLFQSFRVDEIFICPLSGLGFFQTFLKLSYLFTSIFEGKIFSINILEEEKVSFFIWKFTKLDWLSLFSIIFSDKKQIGEVDQKTQDDSNCFNKSFFFDFLYLLRANIFQVFGIFFMMEYSLEDDSFHYCSW